MKFIEELVVEEFLPTVRSMLADELRSRGFTQREVADALGISQSAVSKYAHGEVDRNQSLLNDPRVQGLVERITDGLASGELSRVGALVEIEVFIREHERGGVLAELHEQAMPELASRDDPFSIHDPDSELRVTEQVLTSVRRGLRILENTRGFGGLIPNVGANLVECTPDASGIEDVAGVPGRLFDVKGRVAVPADPEFGASAHVASVLLAARRVVSDARATLNIRYDPELLADLEARGLTVAEFDAEYADIDDAIDAAVGPATDVVYQTGGFGIEPIIYIFAPTAVEVAEIVRALIHDE